MAAKIVVFAIALIFMVSMLVFCTEFFLPISIKADADMICRGVLLEMENAGGLSEDGAEKLCERLEEIGLTDVKVTATENAMRGDKLTLKVEAVYTYSKLTAPLKREDTSVRIVYDKTAISRKVVN